MKKLFACLAISVFLSGSALAADVPAMTNDPAQMPAGTYVVEPSHTHLIFFISHLGFSHYTGQFTDISGKLEYQPQALTQSKASIVINADSVEVNSDKLTDELKGDKFFNTAQYKNIKFVSTSLQAVDKTKGKLTGDLTFMGVTKPVILDVTFNGGGQNPISKQPVLGFDATGTIKRSDFGLKTYLPMVGDDVRLDISAEFVPVQAAPELKR